ncbi:TPA: hypothetical protein DD690_04070 [Candidatus Daviesbacteria bacterium]|nr:hypothetical protein [Candidatus Daviesbacteria bacterium]
MEIKMADASSPDVQLSLSEALAENKEVKGRETRAAREKAEEAGTVFDIAGTMTTSTSIPEAQRAAREAEIKARALEAELRGLDQDWKILNVSPSTGHTRKPGGHKSGRPSSVPLNLLKPFPGMEPPAVHVGKRSR